MGLPLRTGVRPHMAVHLLSVGPLPSGEQRLMVASVQKEAYHPGTRASRQARRSVKLLLRVCRRISHQHDSSCTPTSKTTSPLRP